MSRLVGEGHNRLDAHAKVTGSARYSGEFHASGEMYAALVLSNVSAGRVQQVDTDAARRLPGCIAVVTHQNAPRIAAGNYRTWLQDRTVIHAGQPVALVLAHSPRAARLASTAVSVIYENRPLLPNLSDGRTQAYAPSSVIGEPADSKRGDLSHGLRQSCVSVDATYTTPSHCHSAMEPHAALASWTSDQVTIYTATSGIFAARRVIAQAMQLPVENVCVRMRFQGGGFGSKGGAWWPTLLLIASVARMIGAPVRIELTREEMFTLAGRRAPTQQRIVLGADRTGQLTLIEHEAIQETSPLTDYSDPTCFASRNVYRCPNVQTRHRLIRVNAPQPNAMRAPGEGPGSFALESAMDELAYALRLDPVELRMRNVADCDEHHGRPWSSNGLRRCLIEGAAAFGWTVRGSRSAPRREGRWAMGQGVASAYYPVFQAPAVARVRIESSGQVRLFCGNQDIGTGSLTIMAQAAAAELGVTAEEIVVEYGDTRFPETPMAAGSMGTASVIPAVELAARSVRGQILQAAAADARSPLSGHPLESLRWVSPRELIAPDGAVTSVQNLARRLSCDFWEQEARTRPQEQCEFSASAFGACFAQVCVDRDLGVIRVTRLTAAYAAGRILNSKTARSQYIGGIIFGIGMALHERLESDPPTGLPLNRHLCGYLLPTQADIPDLDVRLIEENDSNPTTHGIKGIGMIGTVGVAAAIANALFDATGQRCRDLPITPERLLSLR